ncbi:hypothetical protein B0H19DRAFT_1290984 [Mycena capillaripes]|nr:hypothetical protein B0H19DRAFT_1290984 [Mycena capillaripes]
MFNLERVTAECSRPVSEWRDRFKTKNLGVRNREAKFSTCPQGREESTEAKHGLLLVLRQNSASQRQLNPFSDWALETRGTRWWSTFASLGRPGVAGKNMFQGFDVAFPADGTDGPFIFVAGGPDEGYYALDGPKSIEMVERQRLRERCGFLNSDEVIAQMKFYIRWDWNVEWYI